ncbi:gag-Pol polyprotein [Trichonephila clavata]|uniref:Gag-Pol polyprotein n=1 Tax=Trichonephila clavata TaxID=2740835 RepID=A0A8X6HH97_TRICU|nr:gag-Pol polyprotein [Trichonephila clavata]
MADRVAKQGTALPQPKQPGTLHSAKSQIKSAVERWNCQRLQRLSLARIGRASFPEAPSITLPRAVSVAAFRMWTGHDYLAAHLHHINVLPSPEYQLGGYGTMNAVHLRTCSALDHSKNYQNSIFKEADLYWSARPLMAQQPSVGVG